MQSWIAIPADSDFSLHNIPFGIYRIGDSVGAATRLGDTLIRLDVLAQLGYLDNLISDHSLLREKTLNRFIALGKSITSAVRRRLQELFAAECSRLRDNPTDWIQISKPIAEVEMMLPIHIPNYTDFYSSREHATNVGSMFRDPANALLPNWLHLPVGYHGRASSIVVSGTPIKRPKGQTKTDDQLAPVFGPTRLLDMELEMGFVIGKETQLGESVSTAQAEDYIFGMVLFNDWSARDIQKWEYVPLGPFLAKNFASSMSPWIITLEALEPFRVPGPEQQPAVLPYLQFNGEKNYDISLSVDLLSPGGASQTICRSNFKYMYWNMCQQLAHHTVNGCNIEVGDLYASGTISGPDPGSFGSMLELTWGGKHPIALPDGTERKFFQDGDTVVLRGHAQKGDVRVGFGELVNTIQPARE
jgi:fumarylacetoacetase